VPPKTLKITWLALAIAFGSTGCARTAADTPAPWQPFSSEFRVVGADGQTVSHGRYWRGRDGSDRKDVQSAAGQVIQIRNIARNVCYRFKEGRGWTVQPMVLPAEGWRPPQPRLDPKAERVMFEGVAGLRVTNAQGDSAVQAPSLNFFRLARTTAASGRVERHFNIVRGEPAPSLFTLPDGVVPTPLTTPGGIVTLAPRDAADDTAGDSGERRGRAGVDRDSK
jgi:hypothetical protein